MARIDTLTNFLTDVATAIKAKKGDDTAIPAENFDTEIANLPSGDDSALVSLIEGTMKNFEIPEGTTKIAEYKFYGCKNLTSITIPNSVTSIRNYAFHGCSGLTSINIPNSVTYIGYSAFESCRSLTSITIPNSVTDISMDTFKSCAGLTRVTIGSSVKRIGSYAFYNCTSLIEIDFSTHTTVPTLNSIDAFNNTSNSLVIKVPLALVDEWKAATNWSTYADKIMGVRL